MVFSGSYFKVMLCGLNVVLCLIEINIIILSLNFVYFTIGVTLVPLSCTFGFVFTHLYMFFVVLCYGLFSTPPPL